MFALGPAQALLLNLPVFSGINIVRIRCCSGSRERQAGEAGADLHQDSGVRRPPWSVAHGVEPPGAGENPVTLPGG